VEIFFVVAKTGRNGLALLEEDRMKLKTLIAAAVMTAVAAPAFAQSFYVVQDVKTKKCTITETKPTTSEVTVVSGDTVYKTKAEAEVGMKTVKVCTTN
jgi:LysM repeat protein